MTRDGTHDTPPNERDRSLGSALDGLETPDYPPDFLASVWARIDEVSGPTSDARRAGAAGSRRPRSWWTRRPVLPVAALAAMAAVAAAAILFGLPGAPDKTGPQSVSAAAVVRIAQTTLGSAQTLQADYVVTIRMVTDASLPTVHQVGEPLHYRLVMRSDGSYRVTLLGAPPPTESVVAGAAYEADTAFDAATGVLRSYGRMYDGMMLAGKRYSTRADEVTGLAPGPPDNAAEYPTYLTDFGAFARALRAVGSGDVKDATYEGRPAWVVSCDVAAGPTERVVFGWGQPQPQADRLSVTVDKHTGLPMRMQQSIRGQPTNELRLANVHLNAPLAADVFDLTLPGDITVRHSDHGFTTARLDEVAATAGRPPLVPTRLPRGYTLTRAATKAKTPSMDEMPLAGVRVVSLRYQRGFDTLTVTTRVSARSVTPEYAIAVDPFMGYRWTGSVSGPSGVMLTSGVFAGVPARYVIAPLTVPHLWAMKDGVLLTISGNATAAELVTMADSMEEFHGTKVSAP